MGNKLVLLFFFFCVNSVHWTQVLWAPRESNISGAFWGLFSSLVMLFQTIVNSSHSSKKFGICSLYPIWSPDRLRSSILLSFLELFEICFPPSTFQQLSIVNYIVSKSLVFVVCTQSDLQTDCDDRRKRSADRNMRLKARLLFSRIRILSRTHLMFYYRLFANSIFNH